MEKKLVLDEFEQKVLRLLLVSYSKDVKFLPKDLYDSILAFLIQEEEYEKCIIFRELLEQGKVKKMTREEYYKITLCK